MNYQQARIFCISATIIIVLFLAGAVFRCTRKENVESAISNSAAPVITHEKEKVPELQQLTLSISPKVGNLAEQFNDINDAHLRYATQIGLKPIRGTKDILRLNTPIVEVRSGDNYRLDKLTHSYPFLVPQAAELLDSIGARFNRKLAEQGGGDYKIKVTSLLRTSESVNRLKQGNVNSTENSAHLYGTTFDISYVGFYEEDGNKVRHTDGELKNLLAEVLLELREQGKCMVKFERKQGCFHITATGL